MNKTEIKQDMILIVSLLSLILLGLALVYSATYNEVDHWQASKWFKQVVFFGVGTLMMIGVAILPLRLYKSLAYPAYFLSLIFLIFLAFGGGVSSHGAGRWISLGGFRFQPSEFAKIAYILALAKLMENRVFDLKNFSNYLAPGMLFLIPFLFILKQPDLSTAMVFMAVTLTSLYWSGLGLLDLFLILSPGISVLTSMNQRVWGLFIIFLVVVMVKKRLGLKLFITNVLLNIGAAFATFMVWNKILKEHQRSRILTFVDPMRDPKGEGYQVIQSKVAIGSGGISGKGFMQGSQTNLDFLPEEHTDFIFSVLGEQFGLMGSAIALILFFLLLFNILRIVTLQKNNFGNLLLIGISTLLSFHIIVNIAMTLGLMPVTGLPLPFLSYGGSFVMTCMIFMGLVFCVRYKSEA